VELILIGIAIFLTLFDMKGRVYTAAMIYCRYCQYCQGW